MKTVPLRDRLYHHLESHKIIRCHQSLVISEIDFMLRRRNLMMRRCDLKSHLLQSQHHITSCVLPEINRSDIEISSSLMRKSRRETVLVRMEQEKFALRSGIESVSQFSGMCDCFFQYISRIHFVRGSVRAVHITDQTRHFSLLWTPGENFKRTQIRIKIHI